MDILAQFQQGITTYSAEESIEFARNLAPFIPEDKTLAFYGDLGVGKSTFVKGLALGWGVVEPITSPSFNIFLTYKGIRNILHLDAYRLQNELQLEELMIDEFLVSPYNLIIEWPSNIIGYLPLDVWSFYFSINSNHSHHIKLGI